MTRTDTAGPRATGASAGAPHPYEMLTPDRILSAVETCGFRCSGGLLALNSYENRVYRVDIEDAPPLAAKFYRPQRWSEAAIVEEHAFIERLAVAEIPAVAPLQHHGRSLHAYAGFSFALFPWQPGRSGELDADARELLGRYLARIHRAGSAVRFLQRPHLRVDERGTASVDYLLQHGFIPDYLHAAYTSVAQELLGHIEMAFADTGAYESLCLHGDCHLSNLLWTAHGAHFVDFDDCCSGPAIQDLWMLLAGSRAEMELQLGDLLRGYSTFAEFDPAQLRLIEPLRSLRMLHYSAWLARRWQDPAFPRNFPWFNTQRYWEEQVLALREQLALVSEPPLAWRAEAFNR